MSSEEFTLHQVEYSERPWGELRTDLAMAGVSAVIANVHRGKEQSAYTPLDFMPYFRHEDPDSVPPQVKGAGPMNSAKAMFAAMNAAFDAREQGRH